MNILWWIFQGALALLAFAGGAYKLFMFDELAKMPATAALSRGGSGALGVFEMVCAILLIVPTATQWMPVLTPPPRRLRWKAWPSPCCTRGIRCS